MKILSPDKQSSIIHRYHKLNFTLLPCMFFSYVETKMNWNTHIMYSAMICNFSFHSYVSCSAIISDYIKRQAWKTGFSVTNIGIHSIVTFAYLYK